MKANFVRFSPPVFDESSSELYSRLYGESGEHFMEIMDSSPHEIAVISRLIAYLSEKKGCE